MVGKEFPDEFKIDFYVPELRCEMSSAVRYYQLVMVDSRSNGRARNCFGYFWGHLAITHGEVTCHYTAISFNNPSFGSSLVHPCGVLSFKLLFLKKN